MSAFVLAVIYFVSGLPNVSVSPTLQYVNTSAFPVIIMCNVSAFPKAMSTRWIKTSLAGKTNTTLAISGDGKYSIFNFDSASQLTIKNITLKDDANYMCFATNAVGTGFSENARVTVTFYLTIFTFHQVNINGAFKRLVNKSICLVSIICVCLNL